MTSDLFGVYLGWLTSQTGVDQQRRSYSDLLQVLLRKEFLWNVPWDDNRIEDGREIRKEFFRETGLEGDLGPISVLEVMVALSRRLEFMAGGNAPGWVWQLITNLELHKLADPIGRRKATVADEILENLIWRNYEPDGQGGFFPLIDTDHDQRKVEIWYQMAMYVEEIHTEY